MEITQIKVKVSTLNKNIFNQLEWTKEWKDGQVVGWVMNPVGMSADLIINHNLGEQLKRVRYTDMFERIMYQPENKTLDAKGLNDKVSSYYHQYPQIILG